MKNNEWVVWLIALVAVVALVVAIVALGKISATGEAVSFWKNSNQNIPIVANSCNADSVCEADNLRIVRSLTLNDSLLEEDDGGKLIIDPESYKTRFKSYVEIDSLKSNNSGTCVPSYVCVSSCGGVLYRSETPCV